MPKQPKRLFVLYWPPDNAAVMPTKKAGEEHAKAWKEKKEAAGWVVHSAHGGYRATNPETGEREACVLREHDPVTKQELPMKLPDALTDEQLQERYFEKPAPKPAKPRRGRKPVGV